MFWSLFSRVGPAGRPRRYLFLHLWGCFSKGACSLMRTDGLCSMDFIKVTSVFICFQDMLPILVHCLRAGRPNRRIASGGREVVQGPGHHNPPQEATPGLHELGVKERLQAKWQLLSVMLLLGSICHCGLRVCASWLPNPRILCSSGCCRVCCSQIRSLGATSPLSPILPTAPPHCTCLCSCAHPAPWSGPCAALSDLAFQSQNPGQGSTHHQNV